MYYVVFHFWDLLGSSILHFFPYALERWKFVFLFFCESGGRKLARFKAYFSISCIGPASIRLPKTDQNKYNISKFDSGILYFWRRKKYTWSIGRDYRLLHMMVDFSPIMSSNFFCSKVCFASKSFFVDTRSKEKIKELKFSLVACIIFTT